jgi:hypothetical protein
MVAKPLKPTTYSVRIRDRDGIPVSEQVRWVLLEWIRELAITAHHEATQSGRPSIGDALKGGA